jgi:hypothetical protein
MPVSGSARKKKILQDWVGGIDDDYRELLEKNGISDSLLVIGRKA